MAHRLLWASWSRSDRSTMRAGVAVAALAIGLLVGVPPAPVRAADDRLDLTTTTTYTVVPDRGVVAVVIDASATNRAPDTRRGNVITSYYFDRISFGVPPEATKVAATQSGTRLRVATTAREGYDEVLVRLRRNLQYRQTAKLRITFELPGGAPRSASDIRVGKAFTTFYAWANGDVSTVRVVLPSGFEYETYGSDVAASTGEGGAIVLTASGIRNPDEWYLWVTADRADSLTHDRLTIATAGSIVVRAWPEDTEWRDRIDDVLTRGLPVLDELVGLDWPVDGDLVVSEVHTPLLEGYSGVYDVESDAIRISEDLDDETILHEVLHAWFNDDLFDGRWINEGLAEAFAIRGLAEIGIDVEEPGPVSSSDEAAFLLNVWPSAGRIVDEAAEAREAYGYAASWTAMNELIDEVGVEKMREVLQAASDRDIAYLGVGGPETMAATADWRQLLDLLEERGGATDAGDVLLEWVLGDRSVALLEQRTSAREAYDELERAGAGWAPPYLVRRPMAEWRFAAAGEAIEAAESALALRDEVAADAAALGVTVPDGMKTAYETATTDLDEATAIGEAQAAALTDLEEAAVAVAAPREPLTQLGLLWGTQPEALLDEAKVDFEADELEGSRSEADATAALIDDAERIGTERATIAVGVTVGALLLATLLVLVVRRRGRRHRDPLTAAGPAGASAVAVRADDGATSSASSSSGSTSAGQASEDHVLAGGEPPVDERSGQPSDDGEPPGDRGAAGTSEGGSGSGEP